MDDVKLSGKVIIVTGAARGMGREMAAGFSAAGAAVTVFDIDWKGAAAADGRTMLLQGDVRSADDCRHCVEETIRRFGALHVLVNNAALGPLAVGTDRAPFWKADVVGWQRLMDVNVNGAFYMARAAAPHMIERGWGRIINISKNREAMHEQANSPYGPSKAALDAATLIWAQDLLGTGVTVNSLQPGGAVDTDFLEPDRRIEGRATGRLLPADIIVPAAVWLASEHSDGITGCRFTGKNWDPKLAPDEAAQRCREESIFRPPRRPSKLDKAWE